MLALLLRLPLLLRFPLLVFVALDVRRLCGGRETDFEGHLRGSDGEV
jgi:hypothetical protein